MENQALLGKKEKTMAESKVGPLHILVVSMGLLVVIYVSYISGISSCEKIGAFEDEIQYRSGLRKSKEKCAPVVKYRSSPWEKLWLDNVRNWQDGKICDALKEQVREIDQFLWDSCTHAVDDRTCAISDNVGHVMVFHRDTGKLEKASTKVLDPKKVRLTADRNFSDKVWSYFEHINPCTGETRREYIEPLVSHLRHPLTGCSLPDKMKVHLVDRSYVVPPQFSADGKKAYLFDAGASTWNSGAGGPSLSFFTSWWQDYVGVTFDHIEAWEGTTPSEQFYATVPEQWKSKTQYHQKWITTSPDKMPFIPTVIQQSTSKDDYVMFKLDIDSAKVETDIVYYLLHHSDDELQWIDEFLWEHHVDNYLMNHAWGKAVDAKMDISESYEFFLRLRKLGIRAHSWI